MVEETNDDRRTDDHKAPLRKWQHVVALIGVVTAIVVVGIAAYAQLFARDDARLETKLLAEVIIADLSQRPAGNLRLSHKDETLQSASTVSLLVTNKGGTHLTPYNEQDLDDIRNPRISIRLQKGAQILEAIAKPIGKDPSSRIVELPSDDANLTTFVVLLMNVDAQVKIDLIVAGVDVARTLDVTAFGLGVTGEYVGSIADPTPAFFLAVSCVLGVLVGSTQGVQFAMVLDYRDRRSRARQIKLFITTLITFGGLLIMLSAFAGFNLGMMVSLACAVFLGLTMPSYLLRSRFLLHTTLAV